MIQIDILFIVFTHTENGIRCSEKGWKDLETENECRSAVNYTQSFAPNAYFHKSGMWAYSPKGCYLGGYNGVRWNSGGDYDIYTWAKMICSTGRY